MPAATTRVNDADAPAASVPRVQFTLPLPPTAGVLQTKTGPLFCVAETKVVFAGRVSASATFCALLGPLFVTVRS